MGLYKLETIKENRLLQYNSSKNKMEPISAWQYDAGSDSFIAIPIEQYNSSKDNFDTLNEAKYRATWVADWGQSYRYLNLKESNSKHGTKYVRQETSPYSRGVEFLFQGWWSTDPNGNAASLFGFDMSTDANSVPSLLKGATIEKVELYLRNLHAYNTYKDVQNKVIPTLKAYIWEHNKKSKPTSIKKSTYFGSGSTSEDKFIKTATYWRGPSVQRPDSPYTANGIKTTPNWKTGAYTGLLNWDIVTSAIVEGSSSSTMSWLPIPTKYGEKFRDKKMSGFALFKNSANDEGEGYGYWGSATVTKEKYLAINSGNRASGFASTNTVTWRPMLRITYRKLNGV